MKVVTWNCNGAFRKKFEALLEFDADLMIVQECENPAEATHNGYKKWAENYLWVGDSKHRGLGIFAKKEVSLTHLPWSDLYEGHAVKYFLPCMVNDDFEVLAVWNHANNSPNFEYIGQLWKYLQINKEKFNDIIIAGDFNSNAKWDEWDRWWNHTDVVRELRELGVESLYHVHMNEEQGKESTNTFFQYRKITKPHHIDYLFASSRFLKKHQYIEVGEHSVWSHLSDHVPLMVHFKEKISRNS